MFFKSIKTYLALLRVHQWYKNLFIFSPLLFFQDGQRDLSFFFLGFLGLCIVSSTTYIINDWLDRKKDALHPTKKHRPLASGKVSSRQAITAIIILAILEIIIMLYMGIFYSGVVLTYFIVTNAYSLYLKNIPVLDVLLISINFVFRSVAGLLSLSQLSVFAPFLFALFGLVVSFTTFKRRADKKLLGNKAVSHKPVLKFYTKQRSYIFRLLGILIFAYGLFGTLKLGINWEKALAVFVFTLITMRIFSKNPKFVISPHKLLWVWYWCVLGVLLLLFLLKIY